MASIGLQGEAREVYLEGSLLNSAGQTAFIATGSHGLAIVDTTNFSHPLLLSELDLPGTSADVVADSHTGFAAVAAGNVGVHVVDITDPLMPVLTTTINLPGSAERIELIDGLLYIGGDELTIVDPLTREKVHSIDLSSRVVDLSHDGNKLAVITADQQLHALDLSAEVAVLRGSTNIPDGVGKVFLAGNIAYVADGREARLVLGPFPDPPAGYSTVALTDPDNPSLISGVDTPVVQSGNLQTVLNGSGLALVAAGFRGLQVHAAANPDTTYDLLPPEYPTPGTAQSVAIGGGIAYVADGSGGLQVINYRDFDTAGVAPTITISANTLDADPNVNGVQVEEGTSIPISTTITDDVQVRNVELLVEGQVVRNDVSFPFDLTAVVPNLPEGSNTASFEIQVRATDTGGNSTLSAPLTLEIIEDITPPDLLQVSLPEILQVPRADGSFLLVGVATVSLLLNESMDTNRIDSSSVVIRNTSISGEPFTPLSTTFRSDDRIAQFSFEKLPLGEYEVHLDENDFTDRAGNLLGTTTITSTFEVIEVTVLNGRNRSGTASHGQC